MAGIRPALKSEPLTLETLIPPEAHALALADEQKAIPALAKDPRMTRALEEAVRYERPVQTFFRTTTRPAEIDAISTGEGEKVLIFFGAANRDPRHCERPDRRLLSVDPLW